ncbi:MAG: lysophospholipid acyltransferase family protein [Myxococcota bacterium]
MEDSETKPPLLERALAFLAASLLRLVGRTSKLRREGEAALLARLAAGRPTILYGLHGHLLVGACDLGRYRPYVMVSQSRDGGRIARTAEHVGFRPVRGSSSRGGVRALLQVVRLLHGPVVCCHVVDGPRGPRGEVKPGLMLMAQRSGAVLIPVLYATSHKWTAGSWDRMQVPLPFGRTVARFLAPRAVPPDLGEAAVESLRLEFELELAREERRLEAEVAGQPGGRGGRSEPEAPPSDVAEVGS